MDRVRLIVASILVIGGLLNIGLAALIYFDEGRFRPASFAIGFSLLTIAIMTSIRKPK